jgi:two-component system response regulator PilR (NtrC family)
VRILAATNRDVEADVRERKFREDLYYRLNVIRIEIPPLRDRMGEVARLAQWFVQRFANEFGKDVRELTPDALRALDAYSFPGNVRELENMMERAVALASGPAIGLGDLPATVSGLSASPAPLLWQLPPEGCVLDEVLGELERRLMLQALERAGGVRKTAAKSLGVSFRSLRYRLTKHGLDLGGASDEDEDTEAAISGVAVSSQRR